MTWYPAYLDSKQEIVDWISNQRNRIDVSDISDVDIKMADTMIFSYLSNERIEIDYTGTVSGSVVSPSDINNMLWAASLAYNFEFLSYRGMIHYTPGGVHRTRVGQVLTEFMRQQPMFFMGRGGDVGNMDPVMPFRSFKQIGQWFVNSYVIAYQNKYKGGNIAKPKVGWDASSRGFGWNADINSYAKADDRLFDTGIV
jgi:hypothetical protein